MLAPSASASDLDLDPVQLFKCWRALQKLNTKETPIIPKSLSKTVDGLLISAPVFTQINSSTVQEIFSSSTNGELKARGLTYRSVDGSSKVLFWPLSTDSIDRQFSFKNAIETILSNESKALDRYLSEPRSNKIELLIEAQNNLSYLLRELRSHSEIPVEVRERFLGFQLNARKLHPTSTLVIENIEFDPSVNSRSSIGSFFGWQEDFQRSMNAISHAISTPYTPREFRVDPELLGPLSQATPLKVPPGSILNGRKSH